MPLVTEGKKSFYLEQFKQQCDEIKNQFVSCTTPESKYHKIIEFGASLPRLEQKFHTAETLVSGCQSLVYLRSSQNDEGLILFEAAADALISAGLAALLIHIYQKLPPEMILQHAPTFLNELGLNTSLSITRTQGFGNIYLHMRRQIIKFLV